MLEQGVKPEIEVFDLAMLYNAANLVKKGLVREAARAIRIACRTRDAGPPLRVRFPARRARGRPAGRNLLPRASAGINGKSTSGASKQADTAERGSRTTCASHPTARP